MALTAGVLVRRDVEIDNNLWNVSHTHTHKHTPRDLLLPQKAEKQLNLSVLQPLWQYFNTFLQGALVQSCEVTLLPFEGFNKVGVSV